MRATDVRSIKEGIRLTAVPTVNETEVAARMTTIAEVKAPPLTETPVASPTREPRVSSARRLNLIPCSGLFDRASRN